MIVVMMFRQRGKGIVGRCRAPMIVPVLMSDMSRRIDDMGQHGEVKPRQRDIERVKRKEYAGQDRSHILPVISAVSGRIRRRDRDHRKCRS